VAPNKTPIIPLSNFFICVYPRAYGAIGAPKIRRTGSHVLVRIARGDEITNR
jgi:hypothetical protein